MFAGAGFAGVEALAELQELTAMALLRHPRLAGVRPRWILVDRGERILGQTPERLAAFAHKLLARRGVEFELGTALASVDAGGAVLSDGRRIDAETVVWTAGVAPNPLVAQLGLPTDDRGRVVVDETLQVAGMPGVWSLGDCAAVPNAATPGDVDPATCQHALRQARRLARNLSGAPKAYRYRTRGMMATLGSRSGIAVVGSIRVRGLSGWLLARGYHLIQLPFAARRVRVMQDWISAALFRRDLAALTDGRG